MSDPSFGGNEHGGLPQPLAPLAPPEQAAFVADMNAAAASGSWPAPEEFPSVVGVAPPRHPSRSALVLIPLCRKGDRVGIERHLQAGNATVLEVDCEGNTPLHVAVEAPRNEIATVQCLLEYGANVDAVNFIGAAPLHYVCLRKSNHRGIANILLENGANIDSQTLAGKTPLHFAAEQQLPELVEVLLIFGANANLPDAEGNGAVHMALAKPGRDTVKREILEHLIAAGAGFSSPNLQGISPMHLACRDGQIRCLQLLAERQADLSAATGRGETGLHLACQRGFAEVTQLLLQAVPQLLDRPDLDGNTPLHVCAMHGSYDSAILLMQMGAQTTLLNDERRTAFDLAKTRGTDLNSTHSPELEQILRDHHKAGCRQS